MSKPKTKSEAANAETLSPEPAPSLNLRLNEPQVTIAIDQKGPLLGGDKVSGSVTLVVTTEKVTRGVVVHCCGGAEVNFMTPDRLLRRRRFRKTNPYEELSSVELFADAWQYLLGGPRVRQYKLTPGTQQMPFAFTLPKNVVASYSGGHGGVEYKIQVKVKGYGEGVRDQVTTVPFPVKAPLDLNYFQDAWKPLSIAAKKTKKIFGFRQGIIGFVLEIPHGGVVVGETVGFTGELVNTTSDWTVESVEIRLFQSDLFAAGGEMTWSKQCIWEDAYDGIGQGKIGYWHGTIGPVPPVPPTNLGGCHIIRLSYWLQVCMTYRKALSRKKYSLIEVGELLVGSVPFDDDEMEKYHLEDEKERQHHALRSGVRYRPSLDEILGEEPSISYFVNFSDHHKHKEDGDHEAPKAHDEDDLHHD